MVPTFMPFPDTFTAVAPVRLVPVRITGTVVPWAPEVGLIEVSVGPCTVNVTVLVVPMGVVTLTVLAPVVALAVITQLALTVVAVGGGAMMVHVTPVPDTVTSVAPVRLVPVRVTGTVVPRTPEVGLIEVSVGPCTVNVTVPLVPPGVVTLTVLAETVAPAEITKFVVI